MREKKDKYFRTVGNNTYIHGWSKQVRWGHVGGNREQSQYWEWKYDRDQILKNIDCYAIETNLGNAGTSGKFSKSA